MIELFLETAIWRIFALIEHLFAGYAERRHVRHVVVSVDLLEAAVLVAEVAPLSVWAVPLAVELPAVLRLVFVVNALLLLV